jgi:hypothetical protein
MIVKKIFSQETEDARPTPEPRNTLTGIKEILEIVH